MLLLFARGGSRGAASRGGPGTRVLLGWLLHALQAGGGAGGEGGEGRRSAGARRTHTDAAPARHGPQPQPQSPLSEQTHVAEASRELGHGPGAHCKGAKRGAPGGRWQVSRQRVGGMLRRGSSEPGTGCGVAPGLLPGAARGFLSWAMLRHAAACHPAHPQAAARLLTLGHDGRQRGLLRRASVAAAARRNTITGFLRVHEGRSHWDTGSSPALQRRLGWSVAHCRVGSGRQVAGGSAAAAQAATAGRPRPARQSGCARAGLQGVWSPIAGACPNKAAAFAHGMTAKQGRCARHPTVDAPCRTLVDCQALGRLLGEASSGVESGGRAAAGLSAGLLTRMWALDALRRGSRAPGMVAETHLSWTGWRPSPRSPSAIAIQAAPMVRYWTWTCQRWSDSRAYPAVAAVNLRRLRLRAPACRFPCHTALNPTGLYMEEQARGVGTGWPMLADPGSAAAVGRCPQCRGRPLPTQLTADPCLSRVSH